MTPQPALASLLVLASTLVGNGKAIDCRIENAFDTPWVPYRAIFKTRNQTFADDREAMRVAIAGKLGAALTELTFEEIDDEGTYVVNSLQTDISQAPVFATAFDGGDDRFEYMERDPYIFAHSTCEPNDRYYVNPNTPMWGLKAIQAPTAWCGSTGSNQIVAAVVDGGINPDHEELQPLFKLKAAVGNCPRDSVGYDAINDQCMTAPRGSHGTNMAGAIGAHGDNNAGVTGVNWTVSLLSSTFMDKGIGCAGTAAAALKYIREAKEAGAADIRVVNLSWGTSKDSSALLDQLTELSKLGVVLVASAGNSGKNIDSKSTYPASYKLPLLISVAATKEDLSLHLSNFGPGSVHVAAPGRLIYTTSVSEAVSLSSPINKKFCAAVEGTSIAAAYVTGAIALLASKCPKLSGEELKTLLLECADDPASLQDLVENRRFLNVGRAMEQVVEKCATLE